MLTRRCSRRTFRLRPSAATNDIFRYCIAYAARKTGVIVHAVCVMSNHQHIVLTDVQGRIPDFARELHRMTAKAMNANQGQWENLWSAEPCHLLELGDDNDTIDKIAYLAANPVDAGLVASPEEWPGVMRVAKECVISEIVRRPASYFGEESSCPARLELRVEPLPIDDFVARVVSAIDRKVHAARAKASGLGWRFLGAAKVMATSFAKRAKSYESRRKIVPRVAAKSMFLRRRMLTEIRVFRCRYHEAIRQWRTGLREVEFPEGTWWMRVFHGAKVSQPALE
jgi:REP element-mobilizing transposase RayT